MDMVFDPDRIRAELSTQPLVDVLLRLDEAVGGRRAISRGKAEFQSLVETFEAGSVRSAPWRDSMPPLSRLLFCEAAFRYVCRPRDEVISFTFTLHHRRGACVGLTAVYYALADALRLPFRPLMYEGHVTIGRTDVFPPQHLEVSRRGRVLPRAIARRLYRPGRDQPHLLGKPEFVAVYLSNQAAFAQLQQGQVSAALEVLDTAVELFPRYCGAWINRAAVQMELGRPDAARRSVDQALRLGPQHHFRSAAQSLRSYLEDRVTQMPTPTAGLLGEKGRKMVIGGEDAESHWSISSPDMNKKYRDGSGACVAGHWCRP